MGGATCAAQPLQQVVFRYNHPMFTNLFRRIQREYAHYQSMTVNARRLLLSNFLYFFAYPLLTTFVNAYIWRQNADINALITFNTMACLGILSGFYLNGILLRRFHVVRLYAFGLFIQTLALGLIIFSSTAKPQPLWIYGLIAGLGGGFFWANRNYLNLIFSRGAHRIYYSSIEHSALLLLRVTVPLFAGLVISAGNLFNLYSTEFGYRLVMLFGMLGMFLSGLFITRSQIPDVEPEPLVLHGVSRRWWLVRAYNFLYNIIVGADYVLPTILIFVLLGQEGTLGIVTSASSVLTAISLYIYGRKGGIPITWATVFIGNLLYIIGTIALAIDFTPITALIFLAGSSIGTALRFSPAYNVTMEIMDQENHVGQYAYVCDNEISFNSGRIIGMTIILLLVPFGQEFILRFTPLLMGAVAMVSLWPLKLMIKSITH